MDSKELESFLKRRLEIRLSNVDGAYLKASLIFKSENYKDEDVIISEDSIGIHTHPKDPFKKPNMYMFKD